MFGGWLWHYPAKKAGVLTIFLAMLASGRFWMDLVQGPVGWHDVWGLAVCLVGFGMGCALLVYHFQKGGEEDTAAKKKIMLVGMAVGALVGALGILSVLRIL